MIKLFPFKDSLVGNNTDDNINNSNNNNNNNNNNNIIVTMFDKTEHIQYQKLQQILLQVILYYIV